MFGFDKISTIRKFWDNYAFEAILGLSIFGILLFALFRIGKKGTWSKSYYIPGSVPTYTPSSVGGKRDSKGELECRRVLQNIFNRPFNKARPDFLSNPVTGGHHNLELDCFESELGLACEYSGKQHYSYVPFFHKNYQHFLNQKYRDDMKVRICKEHGINIIEVPYTVSLDRIEEFLIKELRLLGYVI